MSLNAFKLATTCHDRTLFVDKINVFSVRITGLEPDCRTPTNSAVSRGFGHFQAVLSNTFYNVIMRFITTRYTKSCHDLPRRVL